MNSELDTCHTTHNIQPATWTQVATTSYECDDCGETSTTPRGFTDVCE